MFAIRVERQANGAQVSILLSFGIKVEDVGPISHALGICVSNVTRYIQKRGDNLDVFLFLKTDRIFVFTRACDHEFDGEVAAHAYGFKLDKPSLEGDTGIYEAG